MLSLVLASSGTVAALQLNGCTNAPEAVESIKAVETKPVSPKTKLFNLKDKGAPVNRSGGGA